MTQPKILSRSFFCRHRLCLYTFATRMGTDEYFISDAEKPDSEGKPSVIYQGSYKGAMALIAAEQDKLFASEDAAFAD